MAADPVGNTSVFLIFTVERPQKESTKWLSGPPVGTKAQEALKVQRAELKIFRQEGKRNRKREEEAKKYRLHQEKKREKHKGR